MTDSRTHPVASRLVRALAVLFTLALLAVACGDDSSSTDTTESDEPTTTTESDDTTTTTAEEDDDSAGLGSDGAGGDEREKAVDEFEEEVRTGTGSEDTSGGVAYEGYTTVQDDSGVLSVDVPVEWSDVDGSEGLFGPDVVASVSVQQFLEDFSVPGVEFQATTLSTQTPPEVLGELASRFSTLCAPGAVEDYADPLYTGVSQLFTDCGGTTTSFVWVAIEPADQSFIAIVGVQIVTDRDIEALGTILDTFVVQA